MSKAIGFWVTIARDNGIETAYCSLGKYQENKGTDSFGIKDDEIVYYFESEQELKDDFLNKHSDAKVSRGTI